MWTQVSPAALWQFVCAKGPSEPTRTRTCRRLVGSYRCDEMNEWGVCSTSSWPSSWLKRLHRDRVLKSLSRSRRAYCTIASSKSGIWLSLSRIEPDHPAKSMACRPFVCLVKIACLSSLFLASPWQARILGNPPGNNDRMTPKFMD